jgi:hypothetical protein
MPAAFTAIVIDGKGLPVEKVTGVSLRSERTGGVVEATLSQGRFEIESLRKGKYSVEVTIPGEASILDEIVFVGQPVERRYLSRSGAGGGAPRRMPPIEGLSEETRKRLKAGGIASWADLAWRVVNGVDAGELAKQTGATEEEMRRYVARAEEALGAEELERMREMAARRPMLGDFSRAEMKRLSPFIGGLEPRLAETDLARLRDWIRRLFASDPRAVDNRALMSRIRDQGGRGTCTAFAATAMREYFENARQHGALLDLSEQFNYWISRKDSNVGGDGYGTIGAANHYVGVGGCPEAYWGYETRKINYNISQLPAPRGVLDHADLYKMDALESLPSRNVDALKDCIAAGKAAVISAPVFWSVWNGSTGVIGMPPSGAVSDGGHALCVCGWYDDTDVPGGGYFIIKNSWGLGAARNSPLGEEYRGYYLMPYEYYATLCGDAATFRDATATSARPWIAEYYRNPELEGLPHRVTRVSAVSFDWGLGGPFELSASFPFIGRRNDFSARWTRPERFAGGWYRFTVEIDDGARLWVDDRLLINEWRDGSSRTVSTDIRLAAGEHVIRMEYYERKGSAVAKLRYCSLPWATDYFESADLSGAPLFSRQEPDLDLEWRHHPPGDVATWAFSARSSARMRFEAGDYRFRANSTGGVRVRVDGATVLDSWGGAGGVVESAPTAIAAGDHDVVVEFGNASAESVAAIRIDWYEGCWRTEFYGNRKLEGAPAARRTDAAVDFSWNRNAPDPAVGADDFSVRFSRTICASAGYYRFRTVSDDGIRVSVDGRRIVESWIDKSAATDEADVYLSDGGHDVYVEFYENGGDAACRLSWTPVSWRGEYFANSQLSGTPVVRNDDRIDFEWGTEGPGVPGIGADDFSVRWTRTLLLLPGKYRCALRSDEGLRLWADDRLLIDRWRDQGPSPNVCEFTTAGGEVRIALEYYEHAGNAMVSFEMTPVGWLAEYYPNKDLSGLPTLYRYDDAIDFDWSCGQPDPRLPANGFSARWRRAMRLPVGRYRISATTDDGVRIWIDGRKLIDRWHDRAAAESGASIDLVGRTHELVVEYYENKGGAICRLRLERET